MSGTMMAGLYAAGFILWLAALAGGMWMGYGRGWDHCLEEHAWVHGRHRPGAPQAQAEKTAEWKAAMESRRRPVYYAAPAPDPLFARQAQAAWAAHEEQQLPPPGPERFLAAPPEPDPLTDSQFTAKMAEDFAALDRHIAGLISATDEQLKEITR